MSSLSITLENRAKRLTIMFYEENKLPSRFKPGSKESNRRVNRNSNIEAEFQKAFEEWKEVIDAMISSNMPKDIMKRLLFLELDPGDPFETITKCEDFCHHQEYFIFRRDKCQCSDSELGKLSMLIGAYQKIAEKKIKKSAPLKNELAQELLDKGEIEIDGHKIKLWRGATRDTVTIQEEWNKVKKYGELNQHTTIENPRVCFTGMFQIPRREVSEYASLLGFHVQTEVNKRTRLFVFGSENVSPTKVAKVITLNESGAEIELMDENAFLEMVLNNI